MRQSWRWAVTSAIGVSVAAGAWITCQWRFGLDAEASATVATLAAGLVGAPLAAWASRSDPSGFRRTLTSLDHPQRIFNLPVRNPGFTGRQSLLDAVSAALAEEQTPTVVALHGTGGIGKTSTSVEYAHRHADRYRLVWWIS